LKNQIYNASAISGRITETKQTMESLTQRKQTREFFLDVHITAKITVTNSISSQYCC